MTIWAIVVAAGRGTRFGGPKHTSELAGVPLWQWGRSVLEEAGASGVVVVGDVPGGLAGGPRRRDSVAAGLAALPAEASAVLVHDAARPLATVELAKRVIDRLAVGDVDGVVPAVGVTDAVKSIDASGHVVAVDRASLFVAQTPQGFKPASLLAAHAADDADAADDAELIERWGGTVAFVEGEPSNVKITYPSDLEIAAAMLEGR